MSDMNASLLDYQLLSVSCVS